jgi:hypothetical protein
MFSDSQAAPPTPHQHRPPVVGQLEVRSRLITIDQVFDDGELDRWAGNPDLPPIGVRCHAEQQHPLQHVEFGRAR